jgi:hypothetical protein
MASSRTERITIACTETERGEINRRAAAWPNVSEFLVRAAIPDRESLEVFVKSPESVSLDMIRSALNSGSLPITYLESLPNELREAAADYRSAVLRANGDITEGDKRESFIPKQLSNLEGGAGDFQNDLLRGLVLLPQLGERVEVPESSQAAAAHLVRPGLIAGRRVLYLYPFYRHPARRPYWGVISYGSHEKLGLLLHKKTFGDLIGKPILEGSNARGWLGLVIDVLCKKSDTLGIGFRESFFEEEAAEVVWSRAQTEFPYHFEARRRPIPPKALSFAKKGGMNLLATLKSNKVGLLVFDLLYEGDVQKAAGKEWAIVQFPHGIPTPVGVGFSLSFLPRLLVHSNWKKIKDSARAALPKIQGDLTKCGILVETETRQAP